MLIRKGGLLTFFTWKKKGEVLEGGGVFERENRKPPWQLPRCFFSYNNQFCYIAGSFFANSTRSHWLLRGHMTSNNETVSRRNIWAGNIAKSMTSECNSALLPANVDRWAPLQRGLMNFELQNFQLYNKSLKDWSLGKQSICSPRISMFPEAELWETLRFWKQT